MKALLSGSEQKDRKRSLLEFTDGVRPRPGLNSRRSADAGLQVARSGVSYANVHYK